MPDDDGCCCTAPFNSACCVWSRAEGVPTVCLNIRAAGPPSPKAEAHLPMVCGSRSKAPPRLLPSILGPRAGWRTTSPALWALVPESSAAAGPSLPSAIVPETGLSPSRPSSPPETLHTGLPGSAPIYPMSLRISLWLWFRAKPLLFTVLDSTPDYGYPPIRTSAPTSR